MTDIRGCRQVVEHVAVTGLLVPDRDPSAIGALAVDHGPRTRLGQASPTDSPPTEAKTRHPVRRQPRSSTIVTRLTSPSSGTADVPRCQAPGEMRTARVVSDRRATLMSVDARAPR